MAICQYKRTIGDAERKQAIQLLNLGYGLNLESFTAVNVNVVDCLGNVDRDITQEAPERFESHLGQLSVAENRYVSIHGDYT